MTTHPLQSMVKRIRERDWYRVDLGKGNANSLLGGLVLLMKIVLWLMALMLGWTHL